MTNTTIEPKFNYRVISAFDDARLFPLENPVVRIYSSEFMHKLSHGELSTDTLSIGITGEKAGGKTTIEKVIRQFGEDKGLHLSFNGFKETNDVNIYVSCPEEVRKQRLQALNPLQDISELWRRSQIHDYFHTKPLQEKADVILNGKAEMKDFTKFLTRVFEACIK